MGLVVRPLNLYYGAYASFAPSYDSTNASLSQAASSAVWRTKTSQRALLERMPWEAVLDEGDEGVEALEKASLEPPPPAAGAAPQLAADAFDNLDPSIDGEALKAALADHNENASQSLERCATLLLKLQAM